MLADERGRHCQRARCALERKGAVGNARRGVFVGAGVVRAEQPVPDREDHPEIAVEVDWLDRVMDPVRLRGHEDEAQGSEVRADAGVHEARVPLVRERQVEHFGDVGLQHEQGERHERPRNQVLEAVVARVGEQVELVLRVVHGVEMPEPRHLVLRPVVAPIEHVDRENPDRPFDGGRERGDARDREAREMVPIGRGQDADPCGEDEDMGERLHAEPHEVVREPDAEAVLVGARRPPLFEEQKHGGPAVQRRLGVDRPEDLPRDERVLVDCAGDVRHATGRCEPRRRIPSKRCAPDRCPLRDAPASPSGGVIC
jgi:hypothetical protein